MKFLNNRQRIVSVFCLCIAGFSVNAFAHERYHERGNYQRGYQHRNYEHIYYPSHRAYFSPHSRTWFWYEGSRWHSGLRLPYAINVRLGGIPIELSTPIPYYEHRYVEARYPRPAYVIREERPSHYHRRHHSHHRW